MCCLPITKAATLLPFHSIRAADTCPLLFFHLRCSRLHSQRCLLWLLSKPLRRALLLLIRERYRALNGKWNFFATSSAMMKMPFAESREIPDYWPFQLSPARLDIFPFFFLSLFFVRSHRCATNNFSAVCKNMFTLQIASFQFCFH